MELFIGFFFMLIISDSRQQFLSFAENAKNEYIVLLLLFIIFDFKKFQPLNLLYKRFIPFFIMAFICLFYSFTFLDSFSKTLSYLFMLFIVPNYMSKAFRDHGGTFIKTLIWFGTFMLFVGFVMKLYNPALTTLEDRYSGVLGNPNGLGIYVTMYFLVCAVAFEFFPNLFSRADKLIIYFAIFASLILSDSRSAIFAILIFLSFRYFYKLSPFLGFILFVIILASYQFIDTNIEGVISAMGLQDFFRVKTFADASGRFVAWGFAWLNIKNSIFIGHGFNYTEFLFKKDADALSILGHQGNAHNSYLTFWLDTGLIGLLLYFRGFLISFIQAAKKSRIAIPIMYAVLFSITFESWLCASLNPYTIQLFIILTIISDDEFHTQIEENIISVR